MTTCATVNFASNADALANFDMIYSALDTFGTVMYDLVIDAANSWTPAVTLGDTATFCTVMTMYFEANIDAINTWYGDLVLDSECMSWADYEMVKDSWKWAIKSHKICGKDFYWSKTLVTDNTLRDTVKTTFKDAWKAEKIAWKDWKRATKDLGKIDAACACV